MANQTKAYFKNLIEVSRELSRKEKDILTARLSGKTLRKIGRKYKITAERIRQVEKNILANLIKRARQLLLFD